MADETIIELGLDDAAFKREFEQASRSQESRERSAARRRRPDPEAVKRILAEVRQRRQDEERRAAGPQPTALEAIVGGRLGVGAFLASRASEFGRRLFFPGIGDPGERGAEAAKKLQRFTNVTSTVAAKAAAIDTIIESGLPILRGVIGTGIKESAGDTPVLKEVADLIDRGLKEITDRVQSAKAELSGTVQTIAEATTLSKGFALTGASYGKMPDLLVRLRSVNVRQAKLRSDMNEAALVEGASNVANFTRDAMADVLNKIFGGNPKQ